MSRLDDVLPKQGKVSTVFATGNVIDDGAKASDRVKTWPHEKDTNDELSITLALKQDDESSRSEVDAVISNGCDGMTVCTEGDDRWIGNSGALLLVNIAVVLAVEPAQLVSVS